MTMDEATLRQIRGGRPARHDLAVGQCRLGQDAGADRPRGAAAAARGGPQRILCLTYTKAAAAEMQNRLFARLGEWAMKDDAAAAAALRDAGRDGHRRDPTCWPARAGCSPARWRRRAV
jgi:ATP-dependent helicase/nuclease subunit A